MHKIIYKLVLIWVFVFSWQAGMIYADVIIKVRALNPLNTKETAVIYYPLPKEISKENILKQKITYSLDHSQDEEPLKTTFQISFDEEKGEYYIDDEIFLLPKEVVTLEVHVEDVWGIERAKIEELRDEVGGLLKAWEEGSPEVQSGEEAVAKEETKEFAVMMKLEILNGLDKILERQEKNQIINVGVERHIMAYEDNMDELRQVQQDIVLLANLIQFETQESKEGDLESDELLESETENSAEVQISDEDEVLEGDKNIEK